MKPIRRACSITFPALLNRVFAKRFISARSSLLAVTPTWIRYIFPIAALTCLCENVMRSFSLQATYQSTLKSSMTGVLLAAMHPVRPQCEPG